MGHRSIANTVVYIAVADKRIRNIWASDSKRARPAGFRGESGQSMWSNIRGPIEVRKPRDRA
jgi:hypothetical protein